MRVPLNTGSNSAAYWKQERLILSYNGTAQGDKMHLWSGLAGSYADPIAIYTPDSSNYCYIDVTDYARANLGAIGSTLVFYLKDENAGAGTATLTVTLRGLINPLGIMIPYHFGEGQCAVIPPYKIIGRTSGAVIAELYNMGMTASVTGSAAIQSDRRRIKILGDFAFKAISTGDARKYNLLPQLCGVQYALVRWVSFSGVERLHIFEVTKPKTETADNYMLMPNDNEYNEVKGRVDGFTLRLTDLCPYDLWYYSDVITSSCVDVSLNNGTTFDQVQVTTKNITLPDGDTKTSGKLEIAVNWKRYDAVAM